MKKLNSFAMAYIEAALWSSTDAEDTPLDENYSIEDLSSEALEKIEQDCMAFVEQAGALLDSLDNDQSGHDFWLTRNGLGVGFWARGLGDLGEKLTELSHSFGECHLYVGDDGKVHL